MSSSIKAFITRYLCLKILLEDVTVKETAYKIPSENQLASMFNCARLTSRSALNVLENQGILRSHRGSCYNIEDQATRILMFPRFIHTKYPNVKNEQFSENFEDKIIGKYKKVVTKNFNSNGEQVAQTTWKFSQNTFDLIKSKINNSCDICKLMLDAGIFGEQINEYNTLSSENQILICQIASNNDGEIFYETQTECMEMENFSMRRIILTK